MSSNGKIDKVDPVPLPHITNNIIPLHNILKFHSQEAYKAVVTVLENLAAQNSAADGSLDSLRKKALLTQIIQLREDFVKIYTLTKWAVNSKDVGKCIDLLSWLRQQEFTFDQLGFQLHALNSFSGAKLPNPDLHTALEVLFKGRPQLPSYGYVKAPPILPQKTLEVLEDLNLVLTARMALAEDVPARFAGYTIRDGRVVFLVEHEFEVQITVASGEIESETPFYFVDFHFLFGLDPETALVTDMVTRLPSLSHANLEKSANNALLREGLPGLYVLLHKYSVLFKLYLLARQLKGMVLFAKWRGSIQYNYTTGGSLIVVNYWSSQNLLRGWRSFIEVGMDSRNKLHVRWFKNGRYQKGVGDMLEGNDLLMETVLSVVVSRHLEMLIRKIYAVLSGRGATVSMTTAQQLVLKLTPSSQVVFSINSATGAFYFNEPTPLQAAVSRKINKAAVETERELVAYISDQLQEMQLESFAREVQRKLVATGWITSEVVKLGKLDNSMLSGEVRERAARGLVAEGIDGELNGTLKEVKEEKENGTVNDGPNGVIKDGDSKGDSLRSVRFFRRKTWLPSWFLISLIPPFLDTTYWWVSRIKSVSGEWKIQWMNPLPCPLSRLDYTYFNTLSTQCSNMIIDHVVLEELDLRGVRWVKTDVARIWKEMNMPAVDSDKTAYLSVLVLYNDGIIPVANSATCLFLTISVAKASSTGGTNALTTGTTNKAVANGLSGLTSGTLKILGKLRNIPPSQGAQLSRVFKFDPEHETFEISDTMDLAMDESDGPVLSKLFDGLNRLSAMVTLLADFTKSKVEVVSNSLTDVVVRVDDNIEDLSVILPEKQGSAVQLGVQGKEHGFMGLVVHYLNVELREGPRLIIGILRYLKEVAPIAKSAGTILRTISSRPLKLANGLKRLTFDTKVMNLGLFQYVYHISYVLPSNQKKYLKDKVIVNLTFRQNKFSVEETNLVRILFRDNFNLKNLKYKRLFEMIFKEMGDLEQKTKKVVKLNYDYLVESLMVEETMVRVSNCFVAFLAEDTK